MPFIDLSLCNNSVASAQRLSFFFLTHSETFSTFNRITRPQLMRPSRRVTHLIVSVSGRMKRGICVSRSTTRTLVCFSLGDFVSCFLWKAYRVLRVSKRAFLDEFGILSPSKACFSTLGGNSYSFRVESRESPLEISLQTDFHLSRSLELSLPRLPRINYF